MDTASKRKSKADYGPGQPGKIPLAEEYEFFVLMIQVVEGMLKARENELRPLGISAIQAGLMYVVKTAETTLTASQIARRLLRKPAGIYKLLERMEKQGLLRCIRNVEGKREVRVLLTENGEEAYRRTGNRHVIPRILNQLSPKKRSQLKEILMDLRETTYAELGPRPLLP
jgi:DNA-binding MarR family transcriptional regulator